MPSHNAIGTTSLRLFAIRCVVIATAILGLNYIVWRWMASINWEAWWIAVPLVLAETYSLMDSLLFGVTMWRYRDRDKPPAPPMGLTVDVFITTYNEPLELVMATARAARAIEYPHKTWILDDGNRAELRKIAADEGIGWITRSEDWVNRPRHAKAGNLNNALLSTDGEFMLILDADQMPDPKILDKTLGYFNDRRMALVQTPQVFANVPPHDPLGSQAPLFYGPIQQGKDGWNAAFFCGSNAIIRREALMQLGVMRYVSEVELSLNKALKTAGKVVAKARRELGPGHERLASALTTVANDLQHVQRELREAQSIADVTYRFQRQVDEVARDLVAHEFAALNAELNSIEGLSRTVDVDGSLAVVDDVALNRFAQRDWSPLGAIETVRVLIESVNAEREGEAQAVMPIATISVTEDMATCMRLHGLGWETAYHHEKLADGLAPEDLDSMLTQRLRWAQGTAQVMLRENPLLQKGLTVAQRMMYLATMWTYFSGFAALVYLAAPVIYLTLGILPVQALSTEFFARLVPFLIVNQLLFYIVGRGVKTWRGQQYSLAMFPTWIKSVTSAFGNVFLGRDLDFRVTPKTLQTRSRLPWHLVRPQLIAMAVLVFSVLVGIVRLLAGQADLVGTLVNFMWIAFDLLIFSVVIEAVRYPGYEAWLAGNTRKSRRAKPAGKRRKRHADDRVR